MFRLTALLCSALFLTFTIGGRDEGQLRRGLTEKPRVAATPVRYEPPAPVTPVIAAAPVVEPAQVMPLVYVNATSVNVRQGPSTTDSIIGRLERGESALVVWTDDSGWSRIRIEGDGIEGYVASRYLTGVPSALAY